MNLNTEENRLSMGRVRRKAEAIILLPCRGAEMSGGYHLGERA